jgi:hypothetical protein
LSFQGPTSGNPGALDNATKLTLNFTFGSGFNTGSGVTCQQDVEENDIQDGVYNPSVHNPLDLPSVDCKPGDAGAFPFTFKRIGD